MSTRNKRQHQMASTQNKPQHQNASNRKKSYFVLLSSSVGFDRYGHTNTNTNIVIPTYTKPIPILASRIHTDTDTDIWFGIQIKPIPIPIIGIHRYHTDICIPISRNIGINIGMKPIYRYETDIPGSYQTDTDTD